MTQYKDGAKYITVGKKQVASTKTLEHQRQMVLSVGQETGTF